jgi:transcriptional regulator with XRE-family HTH domain
MSNETIAARVRRCRKKLGLTNEAFSAVVGRSLRTVQRWQSEKSNTIPSLEELRSLSARAKVRLSWLIGS